MPLSLLFWVCFVVWFFFGAYWNRTDFRAWAGNNIVLAALLFMLGWRAFGFIIQGHAFLVPLLLPLLFGLIPGGK